MSEASIRLKYAKHIFAISRPCFNFLPDQVGPEPVISSEVQNYVFSKIVCQLFEQDRR